MAQAKLRAVHREGAEKNDPPMFHTTAKDVHKPKEGDVHIERGFARVEGTKFAATLGSQDKTGVAPRPVHITYRFEERPDRHKLWGMFLHSEDDAELLAQLVVQPANPGGTNDLYGIPLENFKTDKRGFYLHPETGERIRRFADEMTWIPQGEDDGHDEAAFEKARARAAKL